MHSDVSRIYGRLGPVLSLISIFAIALFFKFGINPYSQFGDNPFSNYGAELMAAILFPLIVGEVYYYSSVIEHVDRQRRFRWPFYAGFIGFVELTIDELIVALLPDPFGRNFDMIDVLLYLSGSVIGVAMFYAPAVKARLRKRLRRHDF